MLAGGLSLLEKEAVGPATRQDYAKRVETLQRWVSRSGGFFDASAEGILWILEFMDDMFFDGAPAEEGRKLLAAIRHFFPPFSSKGVGLDVHRIDRALKGWGRHTFTRARAPLPWIGATALFGHLIFNRDLNAAISLALMFLTSVWPGELATLKGKNLARPAPSCQLPFWALALRFMEDEVATKTETFDESAPFTLASHAWILPVLEVLKASRTDDQPLWHQTQAELASMVRDSAAALGMDHMQIVPYSFRHGGASRDLISGERDLFTIKKVLRHLSDTTVRRYEKAGTLALEARKIPLPTRQYGIIVANSLARTFLMPASCPRPPRIPRAS